MNSTTKSAWSIWGIVFFGCLLRFWNFTSLQVEHFDEGVYASNLFFGAESNYTYPSLEFFAPPLVPWLIEWSMILTGSIHWAPFVPGLLFGCATVVLMTALTLRWFGPPMATLVALLAATSDLHMMYTRTALTEPVVLFFLVAAVGCGIEMLRAIHLPDTTPEKSPLTKPLIWSALSGLLTGLAWSSKYSGWLPAAILITSSLLMMLNFESRKHWKTIAICLALMLGMTVLVFSPTLWSLQDVGGYAAVSANHAQYSVGWSAWGTTALKQLQNADQFNSTLSLFALLIWGVCYIYIRKSNAVVSLVFILALFLWSELGLILHVLLAFVGYAVCLWQLMRTPNRTSEQQTLAIVAVVMFVWLGAMTLMTPTYTPYPRLLTILLPPLWFGTALFLDRVLLKDVDQGLIRKDVYWTASADVFLVIVIVFSKFYFSNQVLQDLLNVVAIQPRNAMAAVSEQLTAEMDKTSQPGERIVYVFAEPSLFFQFSNRGEVAGTIANLNFRETKAPVPVFFIWGEHAERTNDFPEMWEQAAGDFELLLDVSAPPSELVRLNQSDLKPDEELSYHLYRVK